MSIKRRFAKHEYLLCCADCGEMITSATDRGFLTIRHPRWKDHVAKDCMNGEYEDKEEDDK